MYNIHYLCINNQHVSKRKHLVPIPLTAFPITVGDTHHDEDDGEQEEDQAGEAVDDGGGGRDGDRGLRHHVDTWQNKTSPIQRGAPAFLLVVIFDRKRRKAILRS